MAQIGYSFSPTFANAELGKRGGSPATPSQDPIQVLNFRLPKVVGAPTSNALSPLQGDTRHGSDFGGAVLQSVLRTVLGPDHADAVMSGSPAAAASPVAMPGRDPGAGILASLAHQQAGTDTTAGWRNQERNLGGGGGDVPEHDSGLQPPPFSSAPPRVESQPPSSPVPPVVIPGGGDRPPTPLESNDPTPSSPPVDMTPPDFSSAPSNPNPRYEDKMNWGEYQQGY